MLGGLSWTRRGFFAASLGLFTSTYLVFPTWHKTTLHQSSPSNGVAITHIFSPFAPRNGSEWQVTLQLAFLALRQAVLFAEAQRIRVEVIAVVFQEDAAIVPAWMHTATMTEGYSSPRGVKYPYMQNLVKILQQRDPGRFVSYANLDILVEREYFVKLNKALLTSEDNTAFTIHHRELNAHFVPAETLQKWHGLADSHEAYKLLQELQAFQGGGAHPGTDCVVFPRSALEGLDFGEVFIGPVPPHGNVWLWGLQRQVDVFAKLDSVTDRLTIHYSDTPETDFADRLKQAKRSRQKAFKLDLVDWRYNCMFSVSALTRMGHGISTAEGCLNYYTKTLQAPSPCRSKSLAEQVAFRDACGILADACSDFAGYANGDKPWTCKRKQMQVHWLEYLYSVFSGT
eukprot:TRINITY_DN111806_c0_g1_i1.p1 TRINITY_DN111806_c0_g1~~TRINITY_DN111806_c0_g1_i1.p1  ORF type:complete len:399 (+),score=46.65 TRINITY_DN111806_c0_g1_i1:132-1328(+)